ncbi:hypothetical protein DFH28DRAFT_1194550 [Melampsora americana]|nr:hypothetical protein DFH28DRAFT_1194550 [Melampsora americana]
MGQTSDSSGICSVSPSSNSNNESVSPSSSSFKKEHAIEQPGKWWSTWNSGISALRGIWNILTTNRCAGKLCEICASLGSILNCKPKSTPICKLKNWLLQLLQTLTGVQWPIYHSQVRQRREEGNLDTTPANETSISSSIQDQPRFGIFLSGLLNRSQLSKNCQGSLNSGLSGIISEKEERKVRVRFADVPCLQRTKSFRSGLDLASTHEEPTLDDRLESTKNSLIDFLCKDEGYEYYSKGGSQHQKVPIWCKSDVLMHLRDYLLSGDIGAESEVKEKIVKQKLKKLVILFIDGHLYDVTQYSNEGEHPGDSTSHNSPGVGHDWFPGYTIDWIDSTSAFHYDLNQHSWMAKHKLKQFLISKVLEDS